MTKLGRLLGTLPLLLEHWVNTVAASRHEPTHDLAADARGMCLRCSSEEGHLVPAPCDAWMTLARRRAEIRAKVEAS